MSVYFAHLFRVAALLSILAVGRSHAAVVSENLLPNTTKGVVLVTDTKTLVDAWNQTQLGELMADPVMEPFTDDMQHQFADRLGRIRDRLGLKLSDLRGVSGGGMGVALILTEKGTSAAVIVIDVSGHITEAKGLLAKVEANLIAQEAETAQKEIGETTAVLVFNLKETDEYPAGQAAYCLAGNLLAASDDLEVLKDVMRRHASKEPAKDSLAGDRAFQAVMQRCRAHAESMEPQIRWFLQPLGYIKAVRAAMPEDKRPGGITVLSVFEQQGFTGIEGVGGFVNLKAGDYEILHRTAVFAPPPHKASPSPYKDICPMDMLTFPNHNDFALPDWVPNNVATCTEFYWNILKAFDNFGPVFDQVVGEGEAGAWRELLESFRDDPIAGEIDIRAELIKHLGRRFIVISDYKLPITTTSERLLFAIEVLDEKAMEAGLKKLLDGDPTIRLREFEGHVIWETVEDEQYKAPAPPTIDIPSFAEEQKRRPRVRKKFDKDGQEAQALPHSAVTVAHGQLMIGSHYDFLIKVLKQAKTPDPLADSIDYKVVDSALDKLGAGGGCLRSFSRTDEEYRDTYEMIKQGKMPESESLLAKMLNSLLGPKKRGVVREPKIDGKDLPDFQLVRRYLGPAGEFVVTEKDGWFAVGFMLKK